MWLLENLKLYMCSHYSCTELCYHRPIMSPVHLKIYRTRWHCCPQLASQGPSNLLYCGTYGPFYIAPVSAHALARVARMSLFASNILYQPASRLFALSILPNKTSSLLFYNPPVPSRSVQIPSS